MTTITGTVPRSLDGRHPFRRSYAYVNFKSALTDETDSVNLDDTDIGVLVQTSCLISDLDLGCIRAPSAYPGAPVSVTDQSSRYPFDPGYGTQRN